MLCGCALIKMLTAACSVSNVQTLVWMKARIVEITRWHGGDFSPSRRLTAEEVTFSFKSSELYFMLASDIKNKRQGRYVWLGWQKQKFCFFRFIVIFHIHFIYLEPLDFFLHLNYGWGLFGMVAHVISPPCLSMSKLSIQVFSSGNYTHGTPAKR